jgi:AraC-like DNA-binding protein
MFLNMASRAKLPNLDHFMRSRANQEPSGISIWSHLDGPPARDVIQTLERPHRTSFFFLLFVIRGTVRYSVDLKALKIGAGEALFVKPWQVRTPPPTKGGAEFFKITFGPEVLARMPVRHRFWMDPLGCPKVTLLPDTALRVENTLESLRDAVLQGGAPEVAWAYLNAASSEVEASYFAGSGSNTPSGGLPEFIRFQELVEERYVGHPTIGDLSRALGLSDTGLYKLSKEWTGLSPKEYINRRIILEAQRFLLYERLPVKELASRLGFSDENYFSRFFRRKTGESASEFQFRYEDSSRKDDDSSPPQARRPK